MNRRFWGFWLFVAFVASMFAIRETHRKEAIETESTPLLFEGVYGYYTRVVTADPGSVTECEGLEKEQYGSTMFFHFFSTLPVHNIDTHISANKNLPPLPPVHPATLVSPATATKLGTFVVDPTVLCRDLVIDAGRAYVGVLRVRLSEEDGRFFFTPIMVPRPTHFPDRGGFDE